MAQINLLIVAFKLDALNGNLSERTIRRWNSLTNQGSQKLCVELVKSQIHTEKTTKMAEVKYAYLEH